MTIVAATKAIRITRPHGRPAVRHRMQVGLVGTDVPGLSPATLERAFRALDLRGQAVRTSAR